MDIDHLLDTADDRNVAAHIIDNLTQPRTAFAGLAMTAPAIAGILNVTPDSFSDGVHSAPALAVCWQAMVTAGADIIDIGGESTAWLRRSPAIRNWRVLPPLSGLRQCGAVLSIDTRHAEVMIGRRWAGHYQ